MELLKNPYVFHRFWMFLGGPLCMACHPGGSIQQPCLRQRWLTIRWMQRIIVVHLGCINYVQAAFESVFFFRWFIYTWNPFVLYFGDLTLQNKVFSIQNRGHLGSRYPYATHGTGICTYIYHKFMVNSKVNIPLPWVDWTHGTGGV